MANTIYDLKLHEKLDVDSGTQVLAVHNGWIYLFQNPNGSMTSCYVTSTKRGRPEGSSSKGSDEQESGSTDQQ